MKWFNRERTKAVLTFPVVTAAMLVKDGSPVDGDFADMCAGELSRGNSFLFISRRVPTVWRLVADCVTK